jgi:hypothetical protein
MNSFCNLLKLTFKVDLKGDLLKINGLDYTVYLMFLRHTLIFFLWMAIMGGAFWIYYGTNSYIEAS